MGTILHEGLKWDKHVRYISSKILRNIGVIKRVRTFLPKETLDTLYKTLLEPHFRYCNIVWGRCNHTQLNKPQQLQNKAARSVAKVRFENTDHAKLLQDLGWLDIEQLITYDTAAMMYKVQKDLVPHETVELFEPFRFTHSYNTRSSDFEDFQLYKALSCIGQRSIAYVSTKTCNELPRYMNKAQSLDVFKDRLRKHLYIF